MAGNREREYWLQSQEKNYYRYSFYSVKTAVIFNIQMPRSGKFQKIEVNLSCIVPINKVPYTISPCMNILGRVLHQNLTKITYAAT